MNSHFYCRIVLSYSQFFVTLWTVGCLPGSSVHGIFQARILEWLPFYPWGDLLTPEIEPESSTSPALHVDSLPAEPLGKPTLVHLP